MSGRYLINTQFFNTSSTLSGVVHSVTGITANPISNWRSDPSDCCESPPVENKSTVSSAGCWVESGCTNWGHDNCSGCDPSSRGTTAPWHGTEACHQRRTPSCPVHQTPPEGVRLKNFDTRLAKTLNKTHAVNSTQIKIMALVPRTMRPRSCPSRTFPNVGAVERSCCQRQLYLDSSMHSRGL